MSWIAAALEQLEQLEQRAPPTPRAFVEPWLLSLPMRELSELMRAQSLSALEMVQRCRLEVPNGHAKA